MVLSVDVGTVAGCGPDITIEKEYTLTYQGSGNCLWTIIGPAGFTIEYTCTKLVIPSGAGCNPNYVTINEGARRCAAIPTAKTSSNTLKLKLSAPSTTANLLCKFTPVANPCDCGVRQSVSYLKVQTGYFSYKDRI